MNTAPEQNAGAGKVLRYLLLAVLLAGIAWGAMQRGEFAKNAEESTLIDAVHFHRLGE